jgi:hypothetical protein
MDRQVPVASKLIAQKWAEEDLKRHRQRIGQASVWRWLPSGALGVAHVPTLRSARTWTTGRRARSATSPRAPSVTK